MPHYPTDFKVHTSVHRKSLSSGAGAQAATLAALATLKAGCASTVTAVAAAPLGPYHLQGSCTYGCCGKEGWYGNPDFRNVNANLTAGVAGLDITGPYGNAFAPAGAWAGTDLLNFDTTLRGSLATITVIDKAIGPGGHATPQQSQELAAAFAQALAVLQNSQAEANQALSKLASYLSWVAPSVNSLPNMAASLQRNVTAWNTAAENNLIAKMNCGTGDIAEQFNAMQSAVNGIFSAWAPPFSTVNGQFQAALSAADVVPGVFISLQSDDGAVVRALTTAQGFAPGNQLRTMWVNIAEKSWAKLVASATAQLVARNGQAASAQQ